MVLGQSLVRAIMFRDKCDDLQLHLCIILHIGPSSHQGSGATAFILQNVFFWSTMSSDVKTFVASCIHCPSTVGGGRVPRPLGLAVYGTSSNDQLQFDYIEIASSSSGEKFVLMLREDHSDYKWIFAFADTVAENAARSIIHWYAAFRVHKGLMSVARSILKTRLCVLFLKASRFRTISLYRTLHGATAPLNVWAKNCFESLMQPRRNFSSVRKNGRTSSRSSKARSTDPLHGNATTFPL